MGRYYYKFNYSYHKRDDIFRRSVDIESEGNPEVLKKKYHQVKEEMELKKTMWLVDKKCIKKETGWVVLYDCEPQFGMREDAEWCKPIQKFCKLCKSEVNLKENCPCNGNVNWKKDLKESIGLMLGRDIKKGNYIIVKSKSGEFILD